MIILDRRSTADRLARLERRLLGAVLELDWLIEDLRSGEVV